MQNTAHTLPPRFVQQNTKHEKINWQSLEDTQVGYISKKYTLEKYTLAQKSLVMVATSLVMVGTPEALLGGLSKTTVAQKCSGAMEIQNNHGRTYQRTD